MFLTSLVGGVVGGMLTDTHVLVARTQELAAVTTTQLNVVDGDRQLRAVLSGQDEQSMTSLSFYDPGGQGRTRVALGVREQSAVLNMSDSAQARLVIGVAQNGRPSISFLGENRQIIQELPLAQFLRQ